MRKRLVEYHQMTAPLIGYYSKEAEAGNTKYAKLTAPSRLLKFALIWKKSSANSKARTDSPLALGERVRVREQARTSKLISNLRPDIHSAFYKNLNLRYSFF